LCFGQGTRMDYRLHREGKDEGTFSLGELRRRRQAGELSGSEWVWCEGMPSWQSLDSILQASGSSLSRTVPPPIPPALPRTIPSAKPKRNWAWMIALGIAVFLGV